MMVALMMGTMAFVACDDDEKTNNPVSEDDAQPALVSVEQILDGCSDIANEVGNAKIGDPYDLFKAGRIEDALYAVESWYSWHSIDDYSNNILSIRNAFYGTRDGRIAANSLATLIQNNNAQLYNAVTEAVNNAYDAIQTIPAPFRNNIGASEVQAAMTACNELDEAIQDLKGYLQRNSALNSDEVLQPILVTYVNDVVLPTYADLKTKNTALYNAVAAFAANPSDNAFKACADAWFEAREPWETSEAFLFGPVDALGLDPNMDSWPLDQVAIANILNSGDYDHLIWGNDDDDETIEAVQSVRGFHTLEFLIFKDGQARTLNGGTSTEAKTLDYTSANAQSWGNYMIQVARLLQQDATKLYDSWTKSYEGGKAYKDLFLSHDINDDEEDEE